MSEMSPLLHLLMHGLRGGCMMIVALLVLVSGIFIWSRHGPDGFLWQNGDLGTLILFAALFLFDVALIWGIGRELSKYRRQ